MLYFVLKIAQLNFNLTVQQIYELYTYYYMLFTVFTYGCVIDFLPFVCDCCSGVFW